MNHYGYFLKLSYENSVVIYFNIKEWTELDEKIGTLDAFITPSYLNSNG